MMMMATNTTTHLRERRWRCRFLLLALWWLALLAMAPSPSESFSTCRPQSQLAFPRCGRKISGRGLVDSAAVSSSCPVHSSIVADDSNNRGERRSLQHSASSLRRRRRRCEVLFVLSSEGGEENVAKRPRRFGEEDDGSGGRWKNNPLLRLPRRLIGKLARQWTGATLTVAAWFRRLSVRAKIVVVTQLAVLILALGGIASTRGARSASYLGGGVAASRRSIEVSYSGFLDLVEQQQTKAPDALGIGTKRPTAAGSKLASGAAGTVVPVMDQVRIGTDRIMYRLYRPTLSTASASASSSPVALGSAVDGSNDQRTILPARILQRQRQRRQQQQRQPRRVAEFITAYTKKVSASPELVKILRDNGVPFAAAPQPNASVLALAVRSFLVTFYFLILWRLYQTISGATGGGGGSSLKDSPGKLARASELPLASFDDIQGIDDSKQEVMELVDTLRYPEKYAILGARAPTGLLLEGPPGTGKTMLARATAASAGVPLLYCSGSDFVEMFVGRGAARVRKLFERAEKLAPCIIFIDELDALGKARDATFGGVGLSRSNDEAEQTLNQLLACMDGLDSSRRICVLAATNRKDVLDPALIRPGRFDRIVKLRLPDSKGREDILRVHCRKLPGFREGSGVDPTRPGSLGKGRVVDLGAIAAVTDGFSGAELEFLVNEAAIRAVRRVSAALRQGVGASDITPHVDALDFEASLVAFYETRRPKSGVVNELWKNLLK